MTNASTADGRGPVDTRAWLRAAGAGDAGRVASLLAAGADVNAAPEGGETALLRAASKGHLQIVRMLLEAGADPNAEREDGFTALGVAVFFGYAEIVRALLAGGADPTARGRLGTTAEQWALFRGFDEIVELLRNPDSAGARDSAGKSAAPAFFPAEGTFSAVVPLSELNEPAALEIVRDADGRESEAQEAATVVRARVSPAPSPPRPGGRRRKVARQSWAFTLVVLGLSVFAGLLAGTSLLGSKRFAERRRPAPPDAAGAPAAAARLPETSPPAEREPEAASGASVVTIAEDDSSAESNAVRPSSLAAGVKPGDARRNAGAGRRARRAEGRAPTSSTPESSPPVLSPTPSDKSEKSKVIQWP